MKKVLALILMASMLLCGLAGCSAAPSDDQQAAAPAADLGLIADGVLTIGMEIGYPPFEYYAEDGTTAIGFDVDFAHALGEAMGLEVNLINTAWDGIFEGIGTNYDVVISAVTISPERQETMDFSTPYINNYQAIVVPKGSDLTFSALTDLSGYAVSMQKETNSDILLDDLISTGSVTNCTPVTNEVVTTSFEQLSNGEVDVVLCDSTVADGYVTREPDKYEIAFVDEAEPEQFGVAIKKGNTAMVEAVNAAMAILESEGFFTDNNSKWFQ